jgi:peptide/nickel transport system permease protein
MAERTTAGRVEAQQPGIREAAVASRRNLRRRAWRMLRRGRLGLVGLIVLAIIALAAIFAPLVAPHNPEVGDLTVNRRCPAFTTCPVLGGGGSAASASPSSIGGFTLPGAGANASAPPKGSLDYPLGTDANGRDVFSRIVYAARISLIVGVAAVLIGGIVGVVAGLLCGFYGGVVDAVIMRIADIQLAFPFILLAIAIVAVLGGSLFNVILVLGIGSWVPYARLVRGQVLSAKQQEYIIAARTIGARDPVILFRHLLPNVITPAIIIATFGIAAAIIGEATLSFLGVGIRPPTPTWGNMLADGRAYVSSAWWLATFPGIAILITVLSINMIGDWVRDVLDPRLRNTD